MFLLIYPGFSTRTNYPPEIISQPATEFQLSAQSYIYDVNAIDPDNDILTYTLYEFPEGMTIDSETGLIIWQPSEEQVGNHPVTVRVEDAEGLFDTQSFTITVIIEINRKDEAVKCAAEWLTTHQDDRGGWTTFKVSKNNALALRALTVTGFNHIPEYNVIRQRTYELQATNGSWDNNISSTYESVMALIAAGEYQESAVIQSAVSWLISIQDADGSWGQRPGNTGAAIKALIDAGEDKNSMVIQNAKQWLLDTQNDDGFWGMYPGGPSYIDRGSYPVLGLVLSCSPDNQTEQNAISNAVNYYLNNFSVIRSSVSYLTYFLNIMNCTGTTSDKTDEALELLRGYQNSDGGWPLAGTGEFALYSMPSNTTLTTIALHEYGETGQRIENAVQWIQNNTTAWGDLLYPFENMYDTSLACAALDSTDSEGTEPALQKGLTRGIETQLPNGTWGAHLIQTSNDCAVSYAYYMLLGLGITDFDVLGKNEAITKAIDFIIAKQDTSTGGWYHYGCDYSIYAPNVYSTCFSLYSLLSSGADPSDSRIIGGVNWLLGHRGNSGEWENIESTCRAVMVLEKVGDYQSIIDKAVNWLKQNQNPDGGWGMPYSNVSDTSWAIIALNGTGNEGLETARGVQWLLSLQNSDCGWASVAGIPASDTRNTALATWALGISKYQMDIELELIFNKPYYYPGDVVRMTVNPLNAEVASLTLSGTVTECGGGVLPITISQDGETFAAQNTF